MEHFVLKTSLAVILIFKMGPGYGYKLLVDNEDVRTTREAHPETQLGVAHTTYSRNLVQINEVKKMQKSRAIINSLHDFNLLVYLKKKDHFIDCALAVHKKWFMIIGNLVFFGLTNLLNLQIFTSKRFS